MLYGSSAASSADRASLGVASPLRHMPIRINGFDKEGKPRTKVGPSSPTLELAGAHDVNPAISGPSTSRGTIPRTRVNRLNMPDTALRAAPNLPASTVSMRDAKTSSGSPREDPNAQIETRAGVSCHSCSTYGKTYALRSSLMRHIKVCGESDRRKCMVCSLVFPSFTGLRQHERRAHESEYWKDLETKLPLSETEIMSSIAKMEARCVKGVFNFKDAMRATGLTLHQIRYRREKPEYRQYLEMTKG